jgi:hypothetical protein
MHVDEGGGPAPYATSVLCVSLVARQGDPCWSINLCWVIHVVPTDIGHSL